ncbi:MAG TPA: M48 family metalloprotease [Steroidobacteraceae bacterium]|nr:M48 family metalloprotease [Steroidobacteraceae bacterium]
MPVREDHPAAAMNEWTIPPQEREGFLAAIARHRAAAWRVTAASVCTLAAAALVVALLSAPLWYALLALGADLLNLVSPTRNLLGDFMDYTYRWQDSPAPAGAMRWIFWLACAALPGAVVVGCIALTLKRALVVLAAQETAALQGRVPHALTLEEQRLRNVIAEMSIAANIRQPIVLIVEGRGAGAGVFGTEAEPLVIISRALLTQLDRAELQGVAAHLVGSIAQGDLVLGQRAALTLAFFNLASRLAVVLSEAGAGRSLARVLAGLVWPTPARMSHVATAIGESFAADPAAPPASSPPHWKHNVRFVLAGPVAMLGFFGGVVSFLVLGPLLSFAWRQRKYMADATAVRLTRDPDTLARALDKLAQAGGGAPLGSWTSHLAVAAGPASRGLMSGAFVPMLPSAEQRLRALRKLGATVTRPVKQVPIKQTLLVGALLAVVGGLTCVLLPLLVFVSVALSMLFLGLPLSLLHLLLRWIGN